VISLRCIAQIQEVRLARARDPPAHTFGISTGCEPSERMVTFLFWERSMPDPRDFRLRSVLWIILATISVAAVLRYALHDYGGLLGEDIRTNALLGAALLSAAVMATFFYRFHR